MNKKPVIGISSSIITDQGGMFPGYKRAYVNKDYVDAVLSSGGCPVILPFISDKETLRQQVSMLDGLILSGGQDIFPLNYNEEPEQKIGEVFPERDEYEFTLLEETKKTGNPILGICRGFQLINVFEGGSLYQDLSYRDENTLKHSQGHSPELKTHSVSIKKGTLLEDIFQTEKLMVNSFHHQIIKQVPEHLTVSARAADGVIEAIEDRNYGFYLAVQWHPEMLYKKHDDIKQLFNRLIKAAKKQTN